MSNEPKFYVLIDADGNSIRSFISNAGFTSVYEDTVECNDGNMVVEIEPESVIEAAKELVQQMPYVMGDLFSAMVHLGDVTLVNTAESAMAECNYGLAIALAMRAIEAPLTASIYWKNSAKFIVAECLFLMDNYKDALPRFKELLDADGIEAVCVASEGLILERIKSCEK